MTRLRVLAVLAAAVTGCCLSPVPALAQNTGSPGPYVVDVRGSTAGLPNSPSFFPALSADTLIPSRGFGLDVGGHVYPFGIGAARVGFGINIIRTWASASTEVAPVATGLPADAVVDPPDVRGTLTALAPQISFNFGGASGWSYARAGLGRAEIVTVAHPVRSGPDVEQRSGSMRSINIGGGARWFTRPRMAVAFDVRFHKLSATGDVLASTVMSASVGVSLR